MEISDRRYSQDCMGIEICTWTDWDELECGELQLYDVIFSFPSMQQYNGEVVIFDIDGQLVVFDKDGKTLFEGYVSDIPEWRAALYRKYAEA